MKSRYFFKQLAGSLLVYALLFLSSGRLDYWQAWIYVTLGFIMTVLNYSLLRPDDALLEERGKPGKNVKNWDKLILSLSFLINIIMFLVAGLDSGRFFWSPLFHPGLMILGGIFTAAGQLLFLTAQKQNPFFSSMVRIQEDRGHVVVDTGLYRLVRHPGYLGSFIQALGFPLLFGSVWSVIPAVISIILIVIRTRLEDRTLRNELKGYVNYCQKTKYMLLPLIG